MGNYKNSAAKINNISNNEMTKKTKKGIIFQGTKNLLSWFSKKRPRLFIILFLGIIIFCYILGVLFPIKPIKPYLVDKGITINELITRGIHLLAALATFTSAFVALFRDELRRTFLEVREIDVNFVEPDKIREQTLEEEGDTDDKKVTKYLCELEFKNLGNVHEKGCEIYIQNISIKNPITVKPIKGYNSLLEWDYSKQTKILIPIKGKAYLTAFSIFPPQNIKEESSVAESIHDAINATIKNLPSTLKINESIEFKGTDIKDNEIIIEYLLCFENNQPKEFSLTIKWDGTWQNRIPEMKEKISINLEFSTNV